MERLGPVIRGITPENGFVLMKESLRILMRRTVTRLNVTSRPVLPSDPGVVLPGETDRDIIVMYPHSCISDISIFMNHAIYAHMLLFLGERVM
jgi:hypothetical protein